VTGVRFAVRLTPKGGRDVVEGWVTGADGARLLKARVSAVPEDGKANAALIALLAKSFGVSNSAVRIASGAQSRIKIVQIEGRPSELNARLEAWGNIA
jgi:uncharacterized protein